MTDATERLRHLCEVVTLEIQHLLLTDGRLFAQPFDVERVMGLAHDPTESEKLDAFVARFGRLQDTTGDKLLPALLRFVGQTPGPVIDNLNLAEKWGWLPSAQTWLDMRQMRNKMVHEYIRDPAVLSDALNTAHEQVPMLATSARRLMQEVEQRLTAHKPTSR